MLLTASRFVWEADRRRLVISMVPPVITAVATAWQLLLTRDLVSAVLTPSGSGDASHIVPPLVGMIAGGTISTLANVFNSQQQQILNEVVGRQMQLRLAKVVSSIEMARFDTPDFQDRLRRAQSGMNRVMGVTWSVMGLGRSVFVMTGVAVALIVIEPILVAIAVLGFIPLWIAQTATSRAMYAFWREQAADDRRRGYITGLFTSREHAKELRAYGLGAYLRVRYLKLSDDRLAELLRHFRRRAPILFAGGVGSAFFNAVSFGALAYLALTGALGLAEAAAAAAGSQQLRAQLDGLVGNSSQLYESALYLQDWDEFLALAPAERRLPKPTGPLLFGHIAVRDVSFGYAVSGATDPPRRALSDISLDIRSGEIIALVGENGSGKTTLAKVLTGLYAPDSGTVSWDDVDTSTVDPAWVHDRVAVLFQDYAHFLLTVRENVGFGRVEHISDEEAIVAAAKRAGADEFVAEWAEGYNAVLGPVFKEGREISIGQWQRIALARAFFRDASLVILDEPTAALDPRAEHELFSRMRELFAGRTVVLISHRFSSVRSADRIYVLHEGRIVESGTHRGLMAEDGRYAELFTMQAAAFDGVE